MPPKKPRRRGRNPKQPTQRQSQKQIVNINFPEKKKRRKRRPVKKDNLQMAVQTLSSNLNMFSSDTQRLNNLENLITELRREARQPITTGVINPVINTSVMETQTDPIISNPTLKKTKKTQTRIPVAVNTPIGGGFIPITEPSINPASATELEEGDPADLFRKGFDFEGGGQPIEKVKKKLKLKIKKRAEASAETPRPNVSDEFIQGGGADTETEIPVKLKKKRKEYQTRGRVADKFYNQGLMRKVFEGMRLTDDDKDRQQYENIMNKMTDDDLLRKMFSGFREITETSRKDSQIEADRLVAEKGREAMKFIEDLEVAEDKTLSFI